MKKRKDECLFCSSRSCHERVVSSRDNGKTYDEIACRNHVKELYKHSDEVAPKVMKYFITSTSRLKRGEAFNGYEEVENWTNAIIADLKTGIWPLRLALNIRLEYQHKSVRKAIVSAEIIA